jgi:hypothetical protein
VPLCLLAYAGEETARNNIVARATREALTSCNARGALLASMSALAQLLTAAGPAAPTGPARAILEANTPLLPNIVAVLGVLVRQGPMAPSLWVDLARRCLDLVHVMSDPRVLAPCCQLVALAVDAVPALMHGRGGAVNGCVGWPCSPAVAGCPVFLHRPHTCTHWTFVAPPPPTAH